MKVGFFGWWKMLIVRLCWCNILRCGYSDLGLVLGVNWISNIRFFVFRLFIVGRLRLVELSGMKVRLVF